MAALTTVEVGEEEGASSFSLFAGKLPYIVFPPPLLL